VRDPYTIANIDLVTAWARQQVVERFGDSVVQGVAPTNAMAEEVCMIGMRQMFHARLPQVKGTAGGVAFLLDEVMPASPAYRWTLNHTMKLDDPLELFPTFIVEAGI
jgi:hypothetical protein